MYSRTFRHPQISHGSSLPRWTAIPAKEKEHTLKKVEDFRGAFLRAASSMAFRRRRERRQRMTNKEEKFVLQLDDWCKFDVFKVALLTNGAPMRKVTLALLDRFDLVDKLHLDRGKLESFLRVISTPPPPPLTA